MSDAEIQPDADADVDLDVVNAALDEGEEVPDPSELEPLTKEEAQYQRDEHGELIPTARSAKIGDEWRRIEIRPTPKGEVMRFQQEYGDQEELELDELDELLEEKVVKPEVDDWEDTNLETYMGCLKAVMRDILGEAPANEFHAEVREELEKRDEEGNPS